MTTEIVIARSSEWYQALADDCKAIVVEKTKIAHQELTEMYLMLGARILEDAKHAPITKIVEAVSTDIRIGKANLWYAVAVVKKYGDDVNKIPVEGAMVSWNKVKRLITPVAGVAEENAPENFDPYGYAGGLCAKQSVENCRIVATEILRILRERK